jgi:ribonuclease HI
MEVITMINNLYGFLVNSHTLNIFTDASIKPIPYCDSYIGIPGCAMYIGQQCVDKFYNILDYATNNKSEITAIQYGIWRAPQVIQNLHTDITRINLFSDSKISIYGIREWIFGWTQRINNGLMISSSGTPVANQFHYLSIVDFMLRMNLSINFYYVKGHCSSTPKGIKAFRDTFIRENKIGPGAQFSDQLVEYLSSRNNYVDAMTRQQFVYVDINKYPPINTCGLERICNFEYFIRNLDMRRYYRLISGYKINTSRTPN